MRLPDLSRFDSLPRFSDGRINYSGSKEAAGVYVIIYFEKELLLVKRSNKVSSLCGEWFFVCGYLDEAAKSVEEKALEELEEETKIVQEDIRSITHFEQVVLKNKGTWFIDVVIVELKNKSDVVLDWEHDEYRWVSLEEASLLLRNDGAKQVLSLFEKEKKL